MSVALDALTQYGAMNHGGMDTWVLAAGGTGQQLNTGELGSNEGNIDVAKDVVQWKMSPQFRELIRGIAVAVLMVMVGKILFAFLNPSKRALGGGAMAIIGGVGNIVKLLIAFVLAIIPDMLMKIVNLVVRGAVMAFSFISGFLPG